MTAAEGVEGEDVGEVENVAASGDGKEIVGEMDGHSGRGDSATVNHIVDVAGEIQMVAAAAAAYSQLDVAVEHRP